MRTSAFRSALLAVRRSTPLASLLAMALGLAALTGCSHMPWAAQAATAPVAVTELIESASDGTPTQAFPQYWKRNTLVIDLQAAASRGGRLTLKPRAGTSWPKRLAFRVMPGSLGLIEVQADQRLLMPVAREGTQPVDLELVPGVYSATTERMVVTWQPVRAPVS
jgi:hypothetical protein